MFPKIVVPPKSSILIGFSIINHPFWGTPILGNIHMIFDLVTRPERRHASIMNGSGTESLADAAGCLMWSLKIPTCMRISFFFKRWPNGIGDMTLFHIFCEQNCQLRIWRFSFTHSVFWNETVYNHLCVLWYKTSEINLNPNNPCTKSLIYSIWFTCTSPPKKGRVFFSSNRFFFLGGGENPKTRQSRHGTPWNFTSRTCNKLGGFLGRCCGSFSKEKDVMGMSWSPKRNPRNTHEVGLSQLEVKQGWNPKQPFINGCFNWMIPNLYIENGCFTKHPFINGWPWGSRGWTNSIQLASGKSPGVFFRLHGPKHASSSTSFSKGFPSPCAHTLLLGGILHVWWGSFDLGGGMFQGMRILLGCFTYIPLFVLRKGGHSELRHDPHFHLKKKQSFFCCWGFVSYL